jgi:hypothetical protein
VTIVMGDERSPWLYGVEGRVCEFCGFVLTSDVLRCCLAAYSVLLGSRTLRSEDRH